MPKLKKRRSSLGSFRKYHYQRWCHPSEHHNATKSIIKTAPKNPRFVTVQVPNDVALYPKLPCIDSKDFSDLPPLLDCNFDSDSDDEICLSDSDDSEKREAEEERKKIRMSCREEVRKVMSKANEKHTRQIIAYLYQDVFDFPPRDEWRDFVTLIATYFYFTKGQRQKVYRVFN